MSAALARVSVPAVFPREELFVTTKLQAFFKSYKEAKNAIEQSLQVSGLDYFDMMIIHAPQPWMDFHTRRPFF